MPDATCYDLDYRPKSYWVYRDPKQRVGARVKGTSRRRLATGELDGDSSMAWTDPYRHEESLPESERRARSATHPALMSGEYLPDYGQGEVEIARVTFASSTGDVTSVRARWEDGKIRYRVVDEYMDEHDPFEISIESSDAPLTFREIISLIDDAGDPWGYEGGESGLLLPAIVANCENGADPQDMVTFATVSSGFYRELKAWYANVLEEWYDENFGGGDDEEDDFD